VWQHQSPIGSEAWWQGILDQIRSCDVFVVALSNDCLQSKPCLAEMDYAKALGLPVLPVIIGDVDSYRIEPIFGVQSVDFRNPDVASGATLVAAVRERAAERKQLPDPLPDPPPIPYEYLQRMGVEVLLDDPRSVAIDSPEELSPSEQSTIVAELHQALRQKDDESVPEDVRRLLRAAKPTKPRMRMMPKTVAIAGAAMVAVIAIAAIAVFVLTGRTSSSGSANKSAPATTTRPSTLVDVAALDGLLLSPDEIDRVMGATAMTVTKTSSTPYDDTTVISDPNCQAIGDEAEMSAYAGSGWSALRAQGLNTRTGAERRRLTAYVGEAVVLFPSTDQAAALLPTAQQRWQACSNRSFTYTPAGQETTVWDQGPVTATDGTLHSTASQVNSTGYACQRALTVRNNVAIDVDACSDNPADFAVDIVHKIAAKVAKQ
jgi:hypothetical protein